MSIPDRPPLRRAQGAKWVDPGGVVKVRDVQIGSGLFYLGDALAMPDASVIDQYAVNPDLSVSAGRGARQPVDAVLAVLSCVGDRAEFWYYVASFGNRKSIVPSPATTDSCDTAEGDREGSPFTFQSHRVLRLLDLNLLSAAVSAVQ